MSDIQLKITNAARKMVQSNPALNVKQLVDEAWRDRLLARVFSGASKENWLLKGGSSMLARVSNSRETRDIDLLNCKEDIETAKSELIELSHVDLDDGFLFVFQTQTEIDIGEMQPYLTGINLKFDVYIGGQSKGKISIDLVTGHTLIGAPVVVMPVNCLNISGIQYVPYRLYPVEDQIADKICAMHETHNGFRSSRVKDLVDLIILALNCDIDGTIAVKAFENEKMLRKLENLEKADIPLSWEKPFLKMTSKTLSIKQFVNFEDAKSFVSDFIEEIINGTAYNKLWHTDLRKWKQNY